LTLQGSICRNDQEAIEKAAIIASQIAEDAPTSEGRHLAVLDSGKKEVIKVSINANSRENRDGSEQTGGRQRARGSGRSRPSARPS
jgi:hypothetical protein